MMLYGCTRFKRKEFSSENQREFERIGIEEVRRFLASNRGGQHLYITSGPPSSEAQAWVRWETEREAFWTRAGIGAAIVAALLALMSCVLTILAWRFPVPPGN
jgi:hypothetical protein